MSSNAICQCMGFFCPIALSRSLQTMRAYTRMHESATIALQMIAMPAGSPNMPLPSQATIVSGTQHTPLRAPVTSQDPCSYLSRHNSHGCASVCQREVACLFDRPLDISNALTKRKGVIGRLCKYVSNSQMSVRNRALPFARSRTQDQCQWPAHTCCRTDPPDFPV